MENKIIRASAGTGKTYRLSLEYIGLLIKYYRLNIHFNEILVITFTKKATAEIRERIFNHLRAIIDNTGEGKELYKNLESILGLQVSEEDRTVLTSYYHEMLLNKNLVKISTIDSFTNDIFKTIISPYLGITAYDIDNTIPQHVYAEIYKSLLEDKENRDIFQSFFNRSGKKKINDFESFVSSLLYNRWIFDFIKKCPNKRSDDLTRQKEAKMWLNKFRESMFELMQKFQIRVMSDYPQYSVADLFKKDFFELFFKKEKSATQNKLSQKVAEKLEKQFLIENHKTLLKTGSFWNGSKLFRKNQQKDFAAELLADYENAKNLLGEYIFFAELIPEENEIQTIAGSVYEKYDRIKFRDKKFTHNDISYYTFKYLYDPELSLIDSFSVTNAFYEYLSTQVRFILIDEFQDTSMIQFKILFPIISEITSGPGVKEYGGVIVVGDEKQSIYGWRGGERDLLLTMPSILNNYVPHFLHTSFRSDNTIIGFINEIFSNSFLQKKLEPVNWPYEQVKASRITDSGYIRFQARNFSNTADEHNDISQVEEAIREFVLDTIVPLITENRIDVKKSAILARRNSDLNNIAAVLDEMGIDYILESSSSVLHHRAVKPLIYLYEFLVYCDLYDLLKFFRSDLVLMDSGELKQILEWHKNYNGEYSTSQLFMELDQIDAVHKVASLLNNTEEPETDPGTKTELINSNLLLFTRNVIREYNLTNLFNQENDLLNINLFLEIISDFENSNRDYPKSLKGFLDYCRDNEQNESFQQLGLDEYNAINLLTIHKAKGLEFETVFLFWNLSANKGRSFGSLNYYLKYFGNFTGLQNYILNYNYDHIIPYCSGKELKADSDNREIIEELNNIYVALTRAKNNLYINFVYKKKGGLLKLFDDLMNSDAVPAEQIILYAIYHYFKNKDLLVPENDFKTAAATGNLRKSVEKSLPSSEKDYSFLNKYIDFDNSKYLKSDAERLKRDEYINFSSVYLVDRDIDKGNIIHYFLSIIRYGSNEEIEYAAQKTIGYFGNLIPESKIQELLQQVTEYLKKNLTELFSEKWDRIFTEYTLFSPAGKELRLDRLMIDQKNREIKIIDYKTGEYYEQQQMNEYIYAVKSLSVVKKGDYKVIGKFVEIPLF
ncbi:UvrD-helicase domain-containing protein [candidate division KSB1 bacterium]|nr:UvrD-helicase domain-containing protein [candidate division KSB1 bacterium]